MNGSQVVGSMKGKKDCYALCLEVCTWWWCGVVVVLRWQLWWWVSGLACVRARGGGDNSDVVATIVLHD